MVEIESLELCSKDDENVKCLQTLELLFIYLFIYLFITDKTTYGASHAYSLQIWYTNVQYIIDNDCYFLMLSASRMKLQMFLVDFMSDGVRISKDIPQSLLKSVQYSLLIWL